MTKFYCPNYVHNAFLKVLLWWLTREAKGTKKRNVYMTRLFHLSIFTMHVHEANVVKRKQQKMCDVQTATVPSKFFSALESYCSSLLVGLLSYNCRRSTLLRLDRWKKFGRAILLPTCTCFHPLCHMIPRRLAYPKIIYFCQPQFTTCSFWLAARSG